MEIKEIEITKIVVAATPGAHIGACIKECLILATKEWRNVELLFNGKVYVIRPNDLLGAVKEKDNMEDEEESNV